MRKISLKRLLSLTGIILVLTLGGIFSLNATAKETDNSKSDTVTVSVDGEERVLDLSVIEDGDEFEGAQSYVDSYADVLNADPDFEENIEDALSTIVYSPRSA